MAPAPHDFQRCLNKTTCYFFRRVLLRMQNSGRATQRYPGLRLFDAVFIGQGAGDSDVPVCRVYQYTGIHYAVWINGAFGSGQRFPKEW